MELVCIELQKEHSRMDLTLLDFTPDFTAMFTISLYSLFLFLVGGGRCERSGRGGV